MNSLSFLTLLTRCQQTANCKSLTENNKDSCFVHDEQKSRSNNTHADTDVHTVNRCNALNLSDMFSTVSQLSSAAPDILLSRRWASVCVALHPALQIRDREQSGPVPPVQADKHCWRPGGLLADHCPRQTPAADKTSPPYSTFV